MSVFADLPPCYRKARHALFMDYSDLTQAQYFQDHFIKRYAVIPQDFYYLCKNNKFLDLENVNPKRLPPLSLPEYQVLQDKINHDLFTFEELENPEKILTKIKEMNDIEAFVANFECFLSQNWHATKRCYWKTFIDQLKTRQCLHIMSVYCRYIRMFMDDQTMLDSFYQEVVTYFSRPAWNKDMFREKATTGSLYHDCWKWMLELVDVYLDFGATVLAMKALDWRQHIWWNFKRFERSREFFGEYYERIKDGKNVFISVIDFEKTYESIYYEPSDDEWPVYSETMDTSSAMA